MPCAKMRGGLTAPEQAFNTDIAEVLHGCSTSSTWMVQTEKEGFDKMVVQKGKVYEVRKQLHLSQGELAEKLGVTRNTVSRWELGTSKPSAENLMALNKLYEALEDPSIQEKTAAPEQAAPEPPKRWPVVVLCIGLACALLIGIISMVGIYSINQKLDPVDTAVPMEELEGEEADMPEKGQIDLRVP